MAVIVAELQGGCPGAESMWPVYELRKCDVVRRSFAGSVADPRCDGCFGLFTLGRLADSTGSEVSRKRWVRKKEQVRWQSKAQIGALIWSSQAGPGGKLLGKPEESLRRRHEEWGAETMAADGPHGSDQRAECGRGREDIRDGSNSSSDSDSDSDRQRGRPADGF
ncbi:hypothetical protein BKA66DRAFT_577050 [Pyrenochaeta sp. MPI-SDFR-AT-0127]|nr:hypothetical protein BKA66DRAFT_577050 [Pyrenochaeta sp. MPI-SDFR-AT-0127]